MADAVQDALRRVIDVEGRPPVPAHPGLAVTRALLEAEARRIRSEVDLPREAVAPSLVEQRTHVAEVLEVLALLLPDLHADGLRYAHLRRTFIDHTEALDGGLYTCSLRLISDQPITPEAFTRMIDAQIAAGACGSSLVRDPAPAAATGA